MGHSMIEFTVYGEAVPQGRPRAAKVGNRVRVYDPSKSSNYKNYVRLAAAENAPDKPLEGPLILSVKVYRSIPKSFGKKKTFAAIAGELRPATKPDIDNYLKAIEDALNDLIWRDDGQIVGVSAEKFYAERPRVEITVTRVSDI